MPFDERNKVIDLGNIPATQYKHNKEIFLPQLQNANRESAHQTRRLELSRVFNRVKEGSSTNPIGNKAPSESNLTPAELDGLKSL